MVDMVCTLLPILAEPKQAERNSRKKVVVTTGGGVTIVDTATLLRMKSVQDYIARFQKAPFSRVLTNCR